MINLSKNVRDPETNKFPMEPNVIDKFQAREPGVIESFARGLDVYNLELTNSLIEKYNIYELEEEFPNEEQLTPVEIKDQVGLDIDRPLTLRQALLAKQYKDEKDKIGERFGETALDPTNPINTIFTWLGAGVATSLDLGNIAADLALLHTGGLAIRKARQASKLYDFAASARKRIQQSKLAFQLKNTKKFQILAKSADKLSNIGKRAIADAKVRSMFRVGTANALVEVAIHNVEASKGNHYDIGPAIAMGVFAPVFLRGAGAVVGRVFGKTPIRSLFRGMAAKIGPKYELPKVTDADIDIIRNKIQKGETLTPVDIDKIIEYDRSASYTQKPFVDDLPDIPNKDVQTVLEATSIDDLISRLEKIKGEDSAENIRNLKTVQLGIKTFGKQYIDAIINIAAGMLNSNHRIDLMSAYNWMRNQKLFKSRLAEVMKQRYGKGYKEFTPDDTDLINMFKSTSDDFNEYHAKASIDKPKEVDVKQPEKIKNLDKRFQEQIEPMLGRNDAIGELAEVSKQITDSFKEFTNCLKGGGKNAE